MTNSMINSLNKSVAIYKDYFFKLIPIYRLINGHFFKKCIIIYENLKIYLKFLIIKNIYLIFAIPRFHKYKIK